MFAKHIGIYLFALVAIFSVSNATTLLSTGPLIMEGQYDILNNMTLKDLGTALIISSPNTILDCHGSTIKADVQGSTGVYSTYSNTTIRNCRFSGFVYDLVIKDAVNVHVDNITGGSDYCLIVSNTNDSTFNNTACTGIALVGIYVTNNSNRNNFTNITLNITGAGNGITVDNGNNNSFDCGNGLLNGSNYTNGGTALYTNASNTTIRNCNITGFGIGIWSDATNILTAINNTLNGTNATADVTREMVFKVSLDEKVGPTGYDDLGFHDGDWQGAPMTFNASTPMGGGNDFDGADQGNFLNFTDTANFNYGNGERMMFHVKINQRALNPICCASIISKGADGGGLGTGYNFGLDTGNGMNLRITYCETMSCAGQFQTYTVVDALPLGVTQDLQVYYQFGNASSMRVWINGSFVSGSWTGGTGTVAPTTNTQTINLGRLNIQQGFGTLDFNGMMDDARLYNLSSEWTDAEAAKLANFSASSYGMRLMSANNTIANNTIKGYNNAIYSVVGNNSVITNNSINTNATGLRYFKNVSNTSTTLNDIRASVWVNNTNASNYFNTSSTGNNYTFANGTHSSVQGSGGFNITYSGGAPNYADQGSDRPFNGTGLMNSFWQGLGSDWFPWTLNFTGGGGGSGLFTPVGGPASFIWQTVVAGNVIQRGGPSAWNWSTWVQGDGILTINGSPTAWRWMPE